MMSTLNHEPMSQAHKPARHVEWQVQSSLDFSACNLGVVDCYRDAIASG